VITDDQELREIIASHYNDIYTRIST